ncbi:MAG: tRNA pseudouridine(54/55) synthase Pus10 [Thermoplasmatales archaeon]|nr:tRNA pseudouridine(54/55) synthase Pus10 [Thermoplasmatales archaeon]
MGDAPLVPFDLTAEALAIAERARGETLCAECFGRLFGRLGRGLTNPQRAERLRERVPALSFRAGSECSLCHGAFDRIPVWVERVVRAGEGIEYHRFTCGSRWEPEDLAREEEFARTIGTPWAESIRAAFNRELGKKVEAATGAAGGSERPDVVFLADLPVGQVQVTIQPLYLYGRYRKLDRTLPQTRWPCRACRGRGCDKCGGTGKTYSESVEEIVAAPVLSATGGEGTRFHGMGREDIDAEPVEVVRVKEAAPEKSYRVVVLGELPEAKVKEALSLALARTIAQRTPTRVAHRRSDRVRPRRIVAADLASWEPGRFTIELRTEAGTYVKEWVEGDGGRTEPSLSGITGIPLKVESLDVLEVHDTYGV